MVATMSSVADRLKNSVLNVTKDWAKQRKAEERRASAKANREARLIRASDYHNFRSAAFEIMEEAYLKASADGTLPASARQVMYQARRTATQRSVFLPATTSRLCGRELSIGILLTTIADTSPSHILIFQSV
jgi:hypothetical protein